MEELLKRPRSILMLKTLYERGAMNVRTFDFYAEMTPRNSRSLREWMEEKGLLVVNPSPTTRRSSDKHIELTPEGRALWELFRQSEPILKAAQQRATRNAARKQHDE